MSKASLAQGKQLLELFSGASTDQVQNLIQAGDLLQMMFRADLSQVDRQAFAALLAPSTKDPSRFDRHLMSLEAQLAQLRTFNRLHWGVLKEEQFEAVGQELSRLDYEADDNVQRVDDLEILYVDFGSPERTLEMWWKVIAANQPNAWRYDGLKTNPEHLRLGPNTRSYESGIHRVRINLVAHWVPEQGRSVQQVRDRAAERGETLAHAEALAAYGLHSELVQQMDGENLPFIDLAGYEATVTGHQAWTDVPYLGWGRIGREVGLNAGWAGFVGQLWAAPVLREP